MTEERDNAAPSQAPEVEIKKPRRGLYVVAGAVPPKRLGLKIGAPIAGFFMAASGVGIGLGESKNLPEPAQQRYDAVKASIGIKDRISYDQDGTPVVDITETSKPPETTVAPTTTVEQTTTTVEPTTTTEQEIINAPEIAGLKFDQATKTYLAEAGNPYGLEAGLEAGVYTKEAIKVNGEMEDAIGLKPSVIEYFQKQYIKNNDCFFPLIFNLNEVKGTEIEDANITVEPDVNWLGVKVPEGTKIYAPLSTKVTFYISNVDWFELDFFAMNKKERIMGVEIYSRKQYSLMDSKGIKFKDHGEILAFEIKVGELVAQIDQKVPLSNADAEEDYNRKYDLLYALIRRDKKVNFFDKILAFDNKKVFILPEETK